MRIKVLRNLGRAMAHQYTEGQVVDVDDKEGDELIKRGLAEVTQEAITAVAKEPQLKAVPAEGSVEKATVDLESYRDKARKKPE